MVVVLSFQSISFRGSQLQQITSNFTIDGVTGPNYYRTFFASGSGFAPATWNQNYYFLFFPSAFSSFANHTSRWGGNLFYFAMYNKVIKC